MSKQLKSLLLLCVPFGLAGCGVLDNARSAKRNQPEVICGPQISANYTVPQWGVLPATPAACCLPFCVDHSQFSMIESVPQSASGAATIRSVPGGIAIDPTVLHPGLMESPIVIPNRNRLPAASTPPLPSTTLPLTRVETSPSEPIPMVASPSDTSLPQTILPDNDAQQETPVTQPPPVPAIDQIQQESAVPLQSGVPQLLLPDIDQPQATGWGDADLPSVPQVADEQLFRYVF